MEGKDEGWWGMWMLMGLHKNIDERFPALFSLLMVELSLGDLKSRN